MKKRKKKYITWLIIFIASAVLTLANYFIPDFIPFVDEIIMTAFTIFSYYQMAKR